MGAIEDFRAAIELLRVKETEFESTPGYWDDFTYIPTGTSDAELYMSDMNNWCFVHTTDYMPPRNANGQIAIPTTSMARNFDVVRSTVHGTLNHVVKSNNGGNWDAKPYVIFAKYNDVVAFNGLPQQIAHADTYFAPDPDTGLVLPQGTYLVRPSDESDTELFKIGEHEATYKTGNYTDREIEILLNIIHERPHTTDASKLYNAYDQYQGKENDEETISKLLGGDDRLIEIWRNSDNKKDFLNGLLAADRDAIIVKVLRNLVVDLAMEKCGFRYLEAHPEKAWTQAVANTANKHGISSSTHNTGHGASVEKEMEVCANKTIVIFNDLFAIGMDADKVYDFCDNMIYKDDTRIVHMIMWCVVMDRPIDVYPIFQDDFACWVDKNPANFKSAKPQKISDYNPHLDTTLKRAADVIKNKFGQWLNYLKRESIYETLRSKFIDRANRVAGSENGIKTLENNSRFPVTERQM